MKKLKDFNGGGFYIALCCCVMVIALVGYAGRYTNRQNDNMQRASEAVQVEDRPTMQPIPSIAPKEVAVPKATKAPKTQTAKTKTTTKSVTASANQTTQDDVKLKETQTTPKFLPPIKGEILEKFSGDNLVYNKTLGDWRTHNGVDIKAEAGSEVKASCDGTVKEVSEGVFGQTILLDNKNGYTTLYAQLENTDMVTVGKDVKAGDVIGKISGTSVGENITEPHLHFEILKDTNNINPTDLTQFSK